MQIKYKVKTVQNIIKKKKKIVQDESVNIFNIIKKIRGTNQ